MKVRLPCQLGKADGTSSGPMMAGRDCARINSEMVFARLIAGRWNLNRPNITNGGRFSRSLAVVTHPCGTASLTSRRRTRENLCWQSGRSFPAFLPPTPGESARENKTLELPSPRRPSAPIVWSISFPNRMERRQIPCRVNSNFAIHSSASSRARPRLRWR